MTAIDIVMPFFGDVDHLYKAVRSVVAQTDTSWRLTVVDDAHPDRSVERWFEDLGHPQIRYVRNRVNIGLNANFGRALEVAEADWLVIMGCDDLLLPGYVARVRTLVARHPRSAVVQPGVMVVDDHGRAVRPLPDRVKQVLRPRGRDAELYGERLAASLLRGNWTYFPSLCWHRETATSIGFPERLEVALDLALLLEVVSRGGTLVVDDEPVFAYRRHTKSASMRGALDGSRFDEERAFFDDMAFHFGSRDWPRAARRARWHATSRLNAAFALPSALRAGRWSSGRVLLRHVLTPPGRPCRCLTGQPGGSSKDSAHMPPG